MSLFRTCAMHFSQSEIFISLLASNKVSILGVESLLSCSAWLFLWCKNAPFLHNIGVNKISSIELKNSTSPVHVVLVSLLVDQLSSLFLIFFGRPKKICPVSDLFCSLSWIFCPVFFKKWEIDRTIGQPRDWPKPHFQNPVDAFFFLFMKKYE